MTMTTVAGFTPSNSRRADATPGFNRALDALEAAGPIQAGHPDEFDALDREMAAGALAVAIRSAQHILTQSERIVLAAALLPEFEISNDPRV
jgi:hypothetical protein